MEPMSMKEKLILGCMAALLAVLIIGSVGCTPRSTAQIMVMAHDTGNRFDSHFQKSDARTEFWMQDSLTLRRSMAMNVGAQDLADAASIPDPAVAARMAWEGATKLADQIASLERVENTERAARAQDIEYARELAQRPIQQAQLSQRQEDARSLFVRDTGSMIVDTGTRMWGEYQQAKTIKDAAAAAEREAEALRAEMAEREAALAEREAHINHPPEIPALPPQESPATSRSR